MAYCSRCGKYMGDNEIFCSNCGTPLQNNKEFVPLYTNVPRKQGMGVAALVLGIIGLLAWILPIIGLPVGIIALVMGIVGIKKSSKGMSIAGLVLGVICLVLTIINAAIGAYQGYRGEAWFQKSAKTVEDGVTGNSSDDEQEINEFSLRDKDGNILMTGGIVSAKVRTAESGNDIKQYAVEIQFDQEATEKFAEITANSIGESIGIYLNGEMVANPKVVSAIVDGYCQIEVGTYEEAQTLSDALQKVNNAE